MRSWPKLTLPWGVLIGCLFISAAIYFSSRDKMMVIATVCGTVATVCLVFLTFLYVRSTWRIEWFTGAMERHSDQQRQIAARKAGIEMVWWDPTADDAARGKFPCDGAHGAVNELSRIYVGLPLELRKKQRGRLAKLWRGF